MYIDTLPPWPPPTNHKPQTREAWPKLANFATTISHSFLGWFSCLRCGNPLGASALATHWTCFALAAWGCSFLLSAVYLSEMVGKVILMGHKISTCHVPVVRSFFILCKVNVIALFFWPYRLWMLDQIKISSPFFSPYFFHFYQTFMPHN